MKHEIQINVPTNLEGISLEQYQKYLEVSKEVDTDTEDGARFITIKILEIFCGMSSKDIHLLPLKVFDVAIAQVMNCLSESTPLIHRFTMRGTDGVEIEFGMIPQLDDMSFGEYVDLDSTITDWKNMHKAMAVLFRPITKSKGEFYDILPYNGYLDYMDLMKYMPLNVALGALVFFYRLGTKLSKLTINSLMNHLTEEERLQVENKFLDKSGVGINQFMQSLEGTYLSLIQLRNNHFTLV